MRLASQLVALIAALTLTATVASAQSGPYAGLAIGYGWSELNTVKTVLTPPPPPPPIYTEFPASSVEGLSGTVFAGYDLAIGRGIIVGLEGDFELMDWNGHFHNDDFTTRWHATLRGRLGYQLMPNTVVYVTGGAAWMHMSVSPDMVGSFGSTLTGYAVGAGAEYALFPKAKLRLEYLYSDFGGHSFDATPLVNERFDPNVHQVRLGIVVPFGN